MRFPDKDENLVGSVCVGSTGRVGIVTARGSIEVDDGDGQQSIEGWQGIGIDGHGTWFSKAPVILSDSAEDFRAKISSRFGGRLSYVA